MVEYIGLKKKEPDAPWANATDFTTEFDDGDTPRNAHDIAQIILRSETELRVGDQADLSDEALFVRDLNREIARVCSKESFGPVLTMEELALVITRGPDTPELRKRKNLRFIIRPIFEHLKDRYIFNTEVGSHKESGNVQQMKAGMIDFWKKVYLGILRKEYKEYLPVRLRDRLTTIAQESDESVRLENSARIERQIAAFHPHKFGYVLRALYETIHGTPVQQKYEKEVAMPQAEFQQLIAEFVEASLSENTKDILSASKEDLQKDPELNTLHAAALQEEKKIRTKLEQAVSLMTTKTEKGRSRTKSKNATRILFDAYNAMITQPKVYIQEAKDLYDPTELSKVVQGYTPFQKKLFALAAFERFIDQGEIDIKLQNELEMLLEELEKGLVEERIGPWAEEVSLICNELLTLPPPIAQNIEQVTLEDIAAEDEVGDVSEEDEVPIKREDKTNERKLDTPQHIVEALRNKRANVGRIVKSLLKLNVKSRAAVFAAIKPFVISEKREVDELRYKLSSALGITVPMKESNAYAEDVRFLIESNGALEGARRKRAWFVLCMIANHTPDFRRRAKLEK